LGSVEPSPAKDLYPSWYQQNKAKPGEKKIIDIVSNKLATDCTPARAKKETIENASSFSGDPFVNPGVNANTSEKDDIHKCDDIKPSITITNTSSPCTTNCTIFIAATQGTHSLTGGGQFGGGTINVIIDGQVVQSFPADQRNLTFSYNGVGNKAVTVELVDSVLYDATDSANISFITQSTPSAPISITSSLSAPPGPFTITWSGGEGPFEVSVDGQKLCDTTERSCPVTLSGSSGDVVQIRVKGSKGATNRDLTIQ
jgi:hypothetical protein